MLLSSFHPMPFKGFSHSISDPGMPEMCPKCDDHDLLVRCTKSLSVIDGDEKKNPNGFCSSSVLNSTEESSLVTVFGNCVPRFVYKRKKRRGLFVSVDAFPDKVPVDTRIGDSYSTIVCEAPAVEKEACAPPFLPSFDIDAKPTNGCSIRPDERLIQVSKIIDVDSVNESCSSRSNVELVSVPRKTPTDETGECSSSSVIVGQAREDNSLSERDFCISVLKSDGLLETAKSSFSSAFENENERSTGKSCGGDICCNCIVCSLPERARKMLICDSCNEAFHLSCCNSRMRSFRDDDEWFCTSCQSQKHILGKSWGNTMRWTRISSESGRPNPLEELSLISLMLRDTGPYRTSVRVGKGFQADIPEWTGPVKGDDMFGEPEKLDTSVQSNFHVFPSRRQPRLSPIGNWLQCKQVMDDKGETICGKWRRAPLFEVQTDDWECFCAVFWDPSHSDCVVPQEVDTEQVLKQLKYIEMLRPQLSSKRRKLARLQVGGSRLSAGTSKKYRVRKTSEEVCKNAEHKVSDPTQTV